MTGIWCDEYVTDFNLHATCRMDCRMRFAANIYVLMFAVVLFRLLDYLSRPTRRLPEVQSGPQMYFSGITTTCHYT